MSRKADIAQVSTIEPIKLASADDGPPQTPALTILFHADPTRIGDQARLPALLSAAGSVQVSRIDTGFSKPGGASHSPLLDPVLSRRGLTITAGANAWRITAGSSPVSVQGAPLVGEIEIDRGAIANGVVIEIADRVVLLLHFVGPPRVRGPQLGLVGDSDVIEDLRDQIRQVADTSLAVLIRGETGTGKELVARALHRSSKRASGPCVAVSMATVFSSLAASELFGHARGSFTGATGEHHGYFVQADGGTLFLDEVGDTPLDVQPMLLRVLETSEIQPVGANAVRKVDVRVVAATDADLEHAVRDQTFRSQLLYRLSNYIITLPPLRQRRDDLGRLFLHFLRIELDAIGELGRLLPPSDGQPPWISMKLAARLALHEWPGNVRELQSIVKQLVISNRGRDQLAASSQLDKQLPVTSREAPLDQRERSRPREITEDELTACLQRHQWKTSIVAVELGISRTSLYAMIEKSERIRKAADLSADEILHSKSTHATLDELAEHLCVSQRGLRLRMRQLGIAIE